MRAALYRNSVIWTAAALAVASLAAASSAQAARAQPARPAGPAALALPAASPSSPGASDISNLGTGGWKVLSSATATQSGAQISSPGFNTSSWLPVANDDAGAPGTEVEALAQNGLCPGDTALQPVNQSSGGAQSVFFATNMQLCYGSMSRIGPVTVNAFAVPWWWRTDFTPNLATGQSATLIVNGVIGSANVWVNGTEVATSATVTGALTPASGHQHDRHGSERFGKPTGSGVVVFPVHQHQPYGGDGVRLRRLDRRQPTAQQLPAVPLR